MHYITFNPTDLLRGQFHILIKRKTKDTKYDVTRSDWYEDSLSVRAKCTQASTRSCKRLKPCMIISDQTKNRTENRCLGSSYIDLAARFDNVLQSLIPVMKFVMKLQHLCKKLMINTMASRILQKSCKKLTIILDVRQSKTVISHDLV